MQWKVGAVENCSNGNAKRCFTVVAVMPPTIRVCVLGITVGALRNPTPTSLLKMLYAAFLRWKPFENLNNIHGGELSYRNL